MLGYWLSILGLVSTLTLVTFYYPLLNSALYLKNSEVRILLVADPQIQGDEFLEAKGWLFGGIDLIFNDFYLRHLFQQSVRSFDPTHVVFLGDLLSSQYISNTEFQLRVSRFKWIFSLPEEANKAQVKYLAGNHDIGYAAEMTQSRHDRFVEAFGPTNSIEYAASHKLVFLNSMALSRTIHDQFFNETMKFIDEILDKDDGKRTLLFSHIPLHKPAGMCVDSPETFRNNDGMVSRQNMLTGEVTQTLLRKLGPIFSFSGHDHEGCQTTFQDQGGNWSPTQSFIGHASRLHHQNSSHHFVHTYSDTASHKNLTFEATVRSSMAEFGGWMGYLEIRKRNETFEYSYISKPYFAHIWIWAVLIVDAVFIGATLILAACVNCCAPTLKTNAKPLKKKKQ